MKEEPSPMNSAPRSAPIHPREELAPKELYWLDHHDWLKDSGYLLRPRFRPGWIPSWKTDPRKSSVLSEDGWRPPFKDCIDAVRLNDNLKVMFKKVKISEHPHEESIATFLSSLGASPANHCVPILQVLRPPDDNDLIILVMPLLRESDEPRFDTIGEAVEFFRQIFEGLQFMRHHHSRVSHCTRTRLLVKYYFIDFGLSRKYDPTEPSPLEPVIQGGDRSVPEFAIPGNFYCDPYPTDIYYLGNLIRQRFLDRSQGFSDIYVYGRCGFESMRPLVDDMVQDDPTKRPKIDEVVARFAEIQKGLSSWKLRYRVIEKKEFTYVPHRIVGHWYRRLYYAFRLYQYLPFRFALLYVP
ncbi:hypothetical protein DFH06DRAFT_1265694 [Mycena polygramma]|nr:hypothetical protein DFH06DRAFT_1265694 [Mycena polygramma]